MANNTPITARVNKGLFGKKSLSTTEPLLNVGSAFKLMTSPFQQGAAGDIITGKNEPKNAVRVKRITPGVDTIVKGEDTIVKGEDTVVPGKKYVPNENAWWKSLSPEQKAAHNKKKRAEIANDPAYQPTIIKGKDTIVKGVDTIVKGEDKEEESTLMVMNEGDAMGSLDRREVDRSITHTSRKTKNAEVNVAKAQAKVDGLKGKEKKEYVSKARNKAKLDQATANLAGRKGNRDAAVLQGQQSTKSGGKVKGTQLDYSKEQTFSATQATVENAANRKENYNAMNGIDSSTTTITNPTIKKDTSKKVNLSGPLGVQVGERKKGVDALAEKTDNGFFAKKSALKMKYFK
jgi:hypothetical protein